jgi:menaquinone-9 beta-reductase
MIPEILPALRSAPYMLSTTEVLIVGGGPAGLAASIALRQRGIDCAVVEALPAGAADSGSRTGIDKACGEGLMPDSRETLARLGIHLSEAVGHPFRGIRFTGAPGGVEAYFPDGCGIGVRRPRLHALLAERAQEAGARLLFGSRVQLWHSERDAEGYMSANVNGAPMRFRWLIGADGQASAVRKWAGLDGAWRRTLRYGFRTHYRVAPWSEYVEVHWGAKGQLYITPVAADCVCAVYITRDPHPHQIDVCAEFPEVAAKLGGRTGELNIATRQRGAVTATCKLRCVATGSVALIGDASGSADAITGEGLAISFRQALALADSIAAGSLDSYRTAHARIGRLPHAMSTLMLTMDRWPVLQHCGLHALAARPAVFRELLEAHMGQRRLPQVLLRQGPSFGWSLLAGAARA